MCVAVWMLPIVRIASKLTRAEQSLTNPGTSHSLAGAPGLWRRDHIPVLDGLRAVAVLLVLYAHLPLETINGFWKKMETAFQPGWLGVDLFFVLSGFLITRILLVDRAKGRPLKLFLFKRVLRIFPIYYLLIVVLLVLEPGPYLWWAAGYLSNVYVAYFGGEAGHSTPLNHAWSLAVEEHFYLVWPVIVMFAPLTLVRWLAQLIGPLVAVVLAALFIGMKWPQAGEAVYYLTPFRMLSLLAGAAIAFNEQALRQTVSRPAALAVVCFVAGIAIMVTALARGGDWLALAKLIGIALISCSLLLGGFVLQTTRFAPVLANPVLAYIGKISYGLYLYHFPIYRALEIEPSPHARTDIASFAAGIALTFVVASLSFYLIERPILKYKDKIAA